MAEKRKDLTKEQIAELYRDLKKSMGQAKKNAEPKPDKSLVDALVSGIRSSMQRDDRGPKRSEPVSRISEAFREPEEMADLMPRATSSGAVRGNVLAVLCVLFFACAKVVLSALEGSGIASVSTAAATMTMTAPAVREESKFSPEEVKILTQLDQRRVQLEQRAGKLSDRERELDEREAKYQVQVAQLRELTERLKSERDRSEKKRSAQVDQLANVYSSMQPQEAAKLMEQLDVQIGFQLIQRMPEKRIGQILALMSPQRALEMTRLLSGRAAE